MLNAVQMVPATSRIRPGSRPGPHPDRVSVRRMQPDDYPMVAERVDAWSGGRFLGVALPRSFLQHFADTSLLLEDTQPVGVLVGFRSQTSAEIAYIHYVSISRARRRRDDQSWTGQLFPSFSSRRISLSSPGRLSSAAAASAPKP